MSNSVPFIDVQLGGIQQEVQGVQLSLKHIGRFEFSREFSTKSLEIAQHDLEHIAERLRNSPDRMQTLLQAVVEGRNIDVRRLTEELRLRESDFQQLGGGIFVAVVVIGVLCCAGAAY